jgi:hypothetical protein
VSVLGLLAGLARAQPPADPPALPTLGLPAPADLAAPPPAPVVSEFAAVQEPAAAHPAPAANAAPPSPPTLAELGKKVEALGKNLTVVTGDEHFKIVLGGAVTVDALYNTSRPVAPGTPFFLPSESPLGYDTRTFDLHARQTTLFALFSAPDVFDFKAGGMVLVSLYDNSVVADRYGLLPILAFGELKNDDWRFAAGLQFDVFNPINPTVLPFSILAASGNAGIYRTQLRVERFIKPDDETQFTLTASLGEPVPTLINDQLRISEDNGLPNLDVRAAVGLGPIEGAGLEAKRPFEVGVSAVCGQLRTIQQPRRVVADVWGLGTDARLALGHLWGVMGEAYVGQGLGTYGGSALQNVNPATFQAIRTAGFFVEGYFYWCPDMVHTHIGYGIDDPADADAGATLPTRNETYYATTLWDVTEAFRVGFQVSYLKTNYAVLKDNDGLVFHTQFRWKF